MKFIVFIFGFFIFFLSLIFSFGDFEFRLKMRGAEHIFQEYISRKSSQEDCFFSDSFEIDKIYSTFGCKKLVEKLQNNSSSFNSEPLRIFIGDSHALPFLKNLNDNEIGIAHGGCLSLPKLQTYVHGKLDASCERFRIFLENYVYEIGNAELYLFYRWPYYFLSQDKRICIENVCGVAALNYSLSKLNHPFRAVGGVPVLPDKSVRMLLGNHDSIDYTSSTDVYFATTVDTRMRLSFFKELSFKNRFDASDILCAFSKEKCLIVHDSKLLYRDDDHLSIAGAKHLISKIRETEFEQ